MLTGKEDRANHSWRKFERQLHDEQFDESADWRALKDIYFTLCQLYNAAGFGDLIIRAKDALSENPVLNEHQFFIFDEYQDFNAAEENLLEQIVDRARAVLIAGDDDQVLYDTLKSGKASLIRTIYRNERVVNAMLPFCGRCDFHITSAASHFIRQAPDPDCIKKIYLPLSQAGASQKVQVVACARPSAAVDYIKKFIEDRQDAIDKRRRDLAAGAAKDAYLLILSPSRDVNFYKLDDARDELFRLVARYRDERRQFSDEYYKVLSYYSLAKYPLNNFTCRKVLFYEGISGNDLLALLTTCLSEEESLSEIDSEHVNNALAKAKALREILDSAKSATEKVQALAECIQIRDVKSLQRDMEKAAIDSERVEATERQDEEEAELEEIAVKQMSALELLTIVGSKGLSADHVIIIGFDNVNMSRVTRNAFFVAETRARLSLHLIMALKAGGATRPPAFLDHLPDGNVEFSKYMKGERKLVGLRDRNEFLTYLKGLNVLGARRS